MCMVTFEWDDCDAKRKVDTFDKKRSVAWAIIELTDKCNFNCMWCYANSHSGGEHMDKEDAKGIIERLSKEGVIQITLSGGEPLLYPDLKEIVEYCKERNMVVHMNTNGYFLTRQTAKELFDLGLSQVQINIDSINSEVHDHVRGREGSFVRALDALKNAKDVGITCVSQTVLTRKNEDEILDIFKMARKIGVQRCRVWEMVPTGHAKGKIESGPTNYVQTLKKLADFAVSTGARNVESGDPLFPLDYDTKLNVSGGYCATLAGLVMIISTKGDVFFCCANREPMYNIFNDFKNDTPLTEFHKNMLEQYKKKLDHLSSDCVRCAHYKSCRGGCTARIRTTNNQRDYLCPF